MPDLTNSRSLTDETLIADLRKAAATWLKNSDLLALEELIRRFSKLNAERAQESAQGR
jgi:hypothetical protein